MRDYEQEVEQIRRFGVVLDESCTLAKALSWVRMILKLFPVNQAARGFMGNRRKIEE